MSASTVTSNRRRQLKINLLQRHFNEATKIWHYMATVMQLYGNCMASVWHLYGNCMNNCFATWLCCETHKHSPSEFVTPLPCSHLHCNITSQPMWTQLLWLAKSLNLVYSRAIRCRCKLLQVEIVTIASVYHMIMMCFSSLSAPFFCGEYLNW